jgi:hypothetical protein
MDKETLEREIARVRERLGQFENNAARFGSHLYYRLLEELQGLERELFKLLRHHHHRPATSVTIHRTGDHMLPIAPGNAPQFQAVLQPANAGPFVAANVAWSVSGDPGASVAQNASDSTGLTATLSLSSSVVVGATLTLSVTVTNQDGSTVSATDTLTVVSGTTPPPAFVPATGAVIQQIV